MITKTFIFTLFALATCATAQATRVIDNVSSASLTGYTAGSSVGVSFVTGSTAVSVDDVVFPQIYQATPDASSPKVNSFSGTETFSLYTNNPATNSPLVASPITFTLDNNTALASGAAGFGQTTAIPSAAMVLTPLTRYWLVLTDVSTVYWDYTSSSAYNSALGVTLPTTNTSYKTSGGTTTFFSLASGPQQFVLDATAVPEPSSVVLLTLAGAAAFLLALRARSAKVA